MPMVKPEWVVAIREAIQRAYKEGRVQSFEDFNRIFLEEWNSLGVKNNRLRGSALLAIRCFSNNNPIIIALRQKEAEANRPISSDSPIEHLPISSRVHLILRRNGLTVVGDIISFLEENRYGLSSLPRIGEQYSNDIHEALKWAGIEIPQLSESSGQTSERPETPEEEPNVCSRTIHLETGEIFRTGFCTAGETGGFVFMFPVLGGLKTLTIRARRVSIEAEG